MSTVIMVGAPALIITGTESTDIIVTNDRTSATSSGWRTSGNDDVREDPQGAGTHVAGGLDQRAVERGHGAGDHQRDERGLLPHEGHDDAAPVEEALALQR